MKLEAVNLLESLISKINGLSVVGSATNPENVLSLYLKLKPDIVFMDVKMGSMSGLDVLEQLQQLGLSPMVVFTTAYDYFAIPAIKKNAFDFLLKPIDKNELSEVIKKARHYLNEHNLERKMDKLERVVLNHHKLRFSTRSGFILIHPDEIIYIEAAANYSEIYASKTKREIVSINIGTIEKMLPEHFIRISRCHIINTAWLTKVSGSLKKCYLKMGDEEISLPIPENHLAEIKRKLDQ